MVDFRINEIIKMMKIVSNHFSFSLSFTFLFPSVPKPPPPHPKHTHSERVKRQIYTETETNREEMEKQCYLVVMRTLFNPSTCRCFTDC